MRDATFKYTHFFAYGFVYAFETIFKVRPTTYPQSVSILCCQVVK